MTPGTHSNNERSNSHLKHQNPPQNINPTQISANPYSTYSFDNAPHSERTHHNSNITHRVPPQNFPSQPPPSYNNIGGHAGGNFDSQNCAKLIAESQAKMQETNDKLGQDRDVI